MQAALKLGPESGVERSRSNGADSDSIVAEGSDIGVTLSSTDSRTTGRYVPCGRDRMECRVTAIETADMVGYSSLMSTKLQ